jgi:hypothetical protein
MFDFEKVMAEKSNAELLGMINDDANKYQHDAIVAAQNELSKRNLSASETATAINQYQLERAETDSKSSERLGVQWKILVFLFPAIATIIISLYFRSAGYDRKAKELVVWTFYGFAFYLLSIVVLKHI